MDKIIVVNIDRCLACKSCEIACAVAHSKSKELQEAIAESPKPQRMLSVESVGEYGVPIQCRHCEDAPCITVCPTSAIHRDSDRAPVLIDKERCIGCKMCLMVCPFGVIDIMRDGKAAVKCDMCIERTKAGQEPACVEACPTKALMMCSEKELTADKRKKIARELVLLTKKDEKEDKKENSK
jgi:carbon-monoxide dehydrogenase iron sulfur subunit